jgi:hypothetical protein
MRTTIDIDASVLEVARRISASRKTTIGSVISDLARRGLESHKTFDVVDELPVFSVAESAPAFGPRDVEMTLDGNE